MRCVYNILGLCSKS